MSRKRSAVEEPETPETPDEETPEVEAEAGNPEAAAPETPALETPQPDEEKENLKKEVATLKGLLERVATAPRADVAAVAPKLTSSYLRMWGPDDRKAAEEKMGIPFEEIIARVETQETRSKNVELEARLNVRDMLDDAVASDATLIRLKSAMKEYIDELPVDVRADPARLKREIERARVYARGKAAESKQPGAAAPKGGSAMRPTPKQPAPTGGDEDDDEAGDSRAGAVKPGAEADFDGRKVRVSNLMTDEMRKKAKHPKDPNGVYFRPGFDEPPRFG